MDIPPLDVQKKIASSITLSIPGPVDVGVRSNVTIVLVNGRVDDYAAYIGAGTDPDFVRKFGEKLSYAQACAFFPAMALEGARYRR